MFSRLRKKHLLSCFLIAPVFMIVFVLGFNCEAQIQLPSATQKNESMMSGVTVLFPDCTCQVDSLRVGSLKLMLAGFRVVEHRKATLGTPA